MNSVQDWLDAYGESHQNPVNKKIHWICVPLIMLSLLGLLWPIQFTFIFDLYNYDIQKDKSEDMKSIDFLKKESFQTSLLNFFSIHFLQVFFYFHLQKLIGLLKKVINLKK